MADQGNLGVVCTPWDNSECTGTPICPPRCPRFFDRDGEPVLIVPFEESDLPELLDMYDRLEPSSTVGGLPPRTREQRERWLEGFIGDGWNILAWDDDHVVGHVGVSTLDESEPEFVIFVDDAHHGRGIGTELLKQMIAHADARGHEALTLFVSRGNTPAISIYENLSFEVTEERLASIAMRLPLEAPIVEEVQQPPGVR